MAQHPSHRHSITIYGRKPVLEALQSDVQVIRLHIALSNKPTGIMADIMQAADRREVEVRQHTRRELSFISKNTRQDQGVALDLAAPHLLSIDELPEDNMRLLALDGVTNPQNVGMIIRSVAASQTHGLVLPAKGNASLGPLVIKASAGTLLHCRIYQCDTLDKAIDYLKNRGFVIYGMEGAGTLALNNLPTNTHSLFVMGNETEGLSAQTKQACDGLVSIPMANAVESLNVSAAATLVAFQDMLKS
jgi:23S rRNA (guanosine2251-2'-O)-methyltransferase